MVAIRSENSPMLISERELAWSKDEVNGVRSTAFNLKEFVDTESERDREVELRTQADGLV
jgi:hypothetical protein